MLFCSFLHLDRFPHKGIPKDQSGGKDNAFSAPAGFSGQSVAKQLKGPLRHGLSYDGYGGKGDFGQRGIWQISKAHYRYILPWPNAQIVQGSKGTVGEKIILGHNGIGRNGLPHQLTDCIVGSLLRLNRQILLENIQLQVGIAPDGAGKAIAPIDGGIAGSHPAGQEGDALAVAGA